MIFSCNTLVFRFLHISMQRVAFRLDGFMEPID